ncbi:MAG: hypothetical protein OSA99_01900 [Acidimicrobiales bacterium]|nr:hypothetical protein [Acidimicrobiales bacterium]
MEIHPVPTDEEAAAIVGAIEAGWPRAAAVDDEPEPPRWRFSARWWGKPIPLRRRRPW